MSSFLAKLSHSTFSVPNRRNLDCTYKAPEDSDDPRAARLRGDRFAPEASYFSVRIAEMRLAEAGNYVNAYLPMCTCFLRYRYGLEEREVPFILNYDRIRAPLREGKATAGTGSIAVLNTYVVKDVPLKAGGVTLFAALCRVSDSSFARGMLDLVGDAAEAVGGASVGLVAKSGIDMVKRLSSLLGSDGVSTRFGIYDGDALIESGYRVLAGAGTDVDQFEVRDGRLQRRNDNGAMASVDDIDYLVLALEYRKTLIDESYATLASMPFHARWIETRKKLVVGETAAAEYDFRQLKTEIVSSPDLVEADRFGVLGAYIAAMEAWKEKQSTTPTLKGDVAAMSAQLADRAANSAGTESSLLDIASTHLIMLDDDARFADDPLSDEAVFEHARKLGAAIESTQADSMALSASTAQLLVASSQP
ncbi:hypothetical protein FAZ95_26930 [Trinickia violacea]|uniref:Uncharacterized protein n=1 Tax=Trinickia violacea TaxID=2571746 RepID=A0A4P8IUI7_9BURK|nr:hypothetical protein [Trinickia violacea]QCP52772.1 hypothetical protein FAZ95_26930 [Trinickia violacea]